MNDKIYPITQKPIREQQQISMRLSRLNDELVRLEKEKIDILDDIVKLESRLHELNQK